MIEKLLTWGAVFFVFKKVLNKPIAVEEKIPRVVKKSPAIGNPFHVNKNNSF